MSGFEKIALEGVSVDSLRLLGEEVLVRAFASEESKTIRREDGTTVDLLVPHGARTSFGRGSEFWGVVVKVGPGRLVERAPSAERISDFVRDAYAEHNCTHQTIEGDAKAVAEAVRDFLKKHTTQERVPLPLVPGDHVFCAQGFGPEVELREGRHHLIRRGGEYGHGILAAWTPDHLHCWHDDERGQPASEGHRARCCQCDERAEITTRLAACSSSVPGPRLAEAPAPAAKVYELKHAVESEVRDFTDFEIAPEDDGRDDDV